MAYAAQKAGLADDYKVTEFPHKKDLGEAITELLERVQPAGARASVYEQLMARVQHELKSLRSFNDPQGIYARLPMELNIH